MKNISNWNDLREYGIYCLTGEACALWARALCDLSEQGCANIREFLGLPHNCPFQDSWNSGAVASCFLPWDVLGSLSAFLLVNNGCSYAVHTADGIYGVEPSDDEKLVGDWLSSQRETIKRYYRTPKGQPCKGCSSVHAMSGRSQ